jgi:hypothetical protein
LKFPTFHDIEERVSMNGREAIRNNIQMADMIAQGYLKDLQDQDLFARAVPGINHIAWQLGHLIKSEHEMVGLTCPGSMPALPAGFAEKYTSETSKLDNPAAFHTKQQYLGILEEQRAATLKALEKLTDADLDQPAPEPLRHFVKTVGEVFNMQGTHWTMHAGQWAVLRRKLGKAPLF